MDFYIETFGCQMNKSDSELIARSMLTCGFERADSVNTADIVIYNTCSVRQHAEDRVISRISSLKNKRKKKCAIILAGCMAQRIGENLLKSGLVDLVIGTFQSPGTGQILNCYFGDNNKNLHTTHEPNDFASRIDLNLIESQDAKPWHKWVTITHGCENYCSYCIVPYVRGPLISLHSDTILAYIKTLSLNNIKEITLLGQNVNQYGSGKDIPFYSLLEKTAKIKGLSRINFLTSHPKDFDENIIRVIKDNENISRSVHLPLQSGSDRILEKMNRKYSSARYMKIIEIIDKELGIYSVSTDLIVGFPGETCEDFNATLELIKKIRFDDAFMYAYSPREGTESFKLRESITGEEKIGRLNELIDLQRKISREKLKARLNCDEEIIVEKVSKRSRDEVMGRTFLNHPVVLPGLPEDIGKKLKIKITQLKGSTLIGKRIA